MSDVANGVLNGDILKNISRVHKQLANVTIEYYGFKGYAAALSPGLQSCLQALENIAVRDLYYTDTSYDVELDNIVPHKKVCVKIGLGNAALNYYCSSAEFVRINRNGLRFETFYIYDIDYLHPESAQNKFIENYLANLKLIKLLQAVADFNKTFAGDCELYFHCGELGHALSIDYNQAHIPDDLAQISTELKTIYHKCIEQSDQKIKRSFKNKLLKSLVENGNSYPALLGNIKSIVKQIVA